MPFYRINGMTVHVRGSKKLSPACSASVGLRTSDGLAMYICAAPSGYQCDWDMGKSRTCDHHVCEAHAHQIGHNKHYCPAHYRDHLDNQSQPGLFTSLVHS